MKPLHLHPPSRARHTRSSTGARVAAATIALGACSFAPVALAQTFNEWQGSSSNWSNGANWSSGSVFNYGQLEFKGNGSTTSNNDTGGAVGQWRVYFSGTKAYTLTSGAGALNLFDFSGAHAWILSDSTVTQTFSTLDVNFAATSGDTYGQVSARSSGNLVFGNIGITGSQVGQLRIAGESTGDIIVNGVISGSGKTIAIGVKEAAGGPAPTTEVIFNGANTYSGDTFIVAGSLSFGSGGTSNSSTMQLGDTAGSNPASLKLTSASGGQSLSSPLVVRSGSSGTMTLASENTSGTNTWTGSITLNKDLTVSQSAGGTLTTSTGAFDVKANKLTVNGAGSVNISQALTSSLGAGGMLLKTGSSTLVLASTSNTYTGTNSATLNANGTQIAGGTLAIAGDTSLGLAPAGAYNNVQFTASGVLRSDAAISLHANRNVSVAAASTATLDNNGNFFTINGVVNGSGNVATQGGGTVKLAGTNTYTGTTTIEEGTLQISSSVLTSTNGPLGNASTDIFLGETASAADARLQANSASTVQVTRDITVNSGAGDRTISNIGGGLFKIDSFFDVFTELSLDNGLATGNIELNGNISESVAGSDLTKNGTGTAILNGNNTFTGDTTINAGTLEVGAAGALGATTSITVNSGGTLLLDGSGNRINNAAALILGGGTFAAAGLSETLGTLSLTANSIIDFGLGASVLSFADSSSINWNGFGLQIWNWSGTPLSGGGTDQLFFGTNNLGLTATQLGLISFFSDNGVTGIPSFAGFVPNGGTSLGEVAPVPEPSGVLVGLAMFGLAGWRERRQSAARRREERGAFAR